jgi:hypothetical protein
LLFAINVGTLRFYFEVISAGDGVAVAQEIPSKKAGKGLHNFDSATDAAGRSPAQLTYFWDGSTT